MALGHGSDREEFPSQYQRYLTCWQAEQEAGKRMIGEDRGLDVKNEHPGTW